jgi:hypothetical protein
VVVPWVWLNPDSAAELEFDKVCTEPVGPPLPDLPRVAMGVGTALPVSVLLVEALDPEVAKPFPLDPAWVMGATSTPGPELPEEPEFPELPDSAAPLEMAFPVFPGLVIPEMAVVVLPLDGVPVPVSPLVV